MRRSTVIYTTIICIAVLYSCSRRPGNVLPERKMTDVLYDIQVAQAMMTSYIDPQYNNVDNKDALVKSVLDKYNITQADFDTSLVWYSDNMAIYMEINDTVAARLRAKAEILRTQITERNKSADELRSRLLPPYFRLTEDEPTLAFNIDSFKIKTMKMDHFKLMFDVQGLAPVSKVTAGLYFTYKDTTIHKTLDVKENEHYLIDKPQLPDSLLKSVSGFIHLRHTDLPTQVLLYNIQYMDSTSQSTAPELNAPQDQAERLRRDSNSLSSPRLKRD